MFSFSYCYFSPVVGLGSNQFFANISMLKRIDSGSCALGGKFNRIDLQWMIWSPKDSDSSRRLFLTITRTSAISINANTFTAFKNSIQIYIYQNLNDMKHLLKLNSIFWCDSYSVKCSMLGDLVMLAALDTHGLVMHSFFLAGSLIFNSLLDNVWADSGRSCGLSNNFKK